MHDYRDMDALAMSKLFLFVLNEVTLAFKTGKYLIDWFISVSHIIIKKKQHKVMLNLHLKYTFKIFNGLLSNANDDTKKRK